MGWTKPLTNWAKYGRKVSNVSWLNQIKSPMVWFLRKNQLLPGLNPKMSCFLYHIPMVLSLLKSRILRGWLDTIDSYVTVHGNKNHRGIPIFVVTNTPKFMVDSWWPKICLAQNLCGFQPNFHTPAVRTPASAGPLPSWHGQARRGPPGWPWVIFSPDEAVENPMNPLGFDYLTMETWKNWGTIH